jgi:hypothetical protein
VELVPVRRDTELGNRRHGELEWGLKEVEEGSGRCEIVREMQPGGGTPMAGGGALDGGGGMRCSSSFYRRQRG